MPLSPNRDVSRLQKLPEVVPAIAGISARRYLHWGKISINSGQCPPSGLTVRPPAGSVSANAGKPFTLLNVVIRPGLSLPFQPCAADASNKPVSYHLQAGGLRARAYIVHSLPLIPTGVRKEIPRYNGKNGVRFRIRAKKRRAAGGQAVTSALDR